MKTAITNGLTSLKKPIAYAVTLLMLISIVIPLVNAATIEATVVTATPGNPITVTAGQTTTVNFQIDLSAGGKLDSRITATNPSSTRVQTQYYLTGGVVSSNTWSSTVKFYDGGNTVSTSENNVISASITVDSTTKAGDYQVSIVLDTATNPTLTPQANSNQILALPNAPSKILVHVEAPAPTVLPSPTPAPDTTPPTITAPANIQFEGNTAGGANIPATLNLGTPVVSDNKDPSPAVTNDFVGGYAAVDQTLTVIWTAIDASGNKASATQTITVVDTTPPKITTQATVSTAVNAPKTVFTATAYDIVYGAVQVINNAPANFKVGTTTVTWTATDGSGNTATATTQVQATYNFVGFYSPVNGGSTSKAGSTIPIKFTLTDYYGNYYTTATATITYTKVAATGLEASQPAAAQGATVFRYDTTSNQYIFNWATPKIAGSYQIAVALNDGTSRTVNVTLK